MCAFYAGAMIVGIWWFVLYGVKPLCKHAWMLSNGGAR